METTENQIKISATNEAGFIAILNLLNELPSRIKDQIESAIAGLIHPWLRPASS